VTADPRLLDELRVVGLAALTWLAVAIGGSPLGVDQPWSVVTAAAVAAAIAVVLAARRMAGRRGGLRLSPRLSAFAIPIAVVALGFALSARAQARYRPMEPGWVEAPAVVRSDAEPIGSGWRTEIQLDTGERIEAMAFGTSGFAVRQLAVGDRVLVAGRVAEIGERPWLRHRHVVGRLGVETVTLLDRAGGFDRLVNGLRQVVADGAVGFDSGQEALYLGLVIGDDRFQLLSQRARFRAAGLTHLLAVSGQNVAFVLLVVRPLLLLCGYRLRIVVVVTVLVLFVAVTRAEPSVLRATAAALVGAWATTSGRSRSGLRALAGGVIVVLLLDPFLVNVVGFQLSVAASAGIIVFGPSLARRLPLPSVLAEATAVTIAAQLAVAPLLITYFGPLPLAALPANVLAGWAAGAVMTTGLTVGPLAGLMATAGLSNAAHITQTPSRLLVDWIDAAARWATALPMARLDGATLLMLALVSGAVALRARAGRVATMTLVIGAAMLTATLRTATPHRPVFPVQLDSGAVYVPSSAQDPSVLVIPKGCSVTILDELLARRIESVDVVVTESGDRTAGRLVTAVTEVVDVEIVLAPSLHRIRGASRVTKRRELTTGYGIVVIDQGLTGNRLVVEVVTTGR
jgi:competence protein ComEC